MLAELVKFVKDILASNGSELSAAGFHIMETDKGQGVVLLRRLRLIELANTPDQPAAILRFLKKTHSLLVDSGVLTAIAVAFRQRFGGVSAPHDEDD